MRRIIYGMIITALYTFVEYLMITQVDSLSLQLLPIIVLGFSMSCLWHIGFMSGLNKDANSEAHK